MTSAETTLYRFSWALAVYLLVRSLDYLTLPRPYTDGVLDVICVAVLLLTAWLVQKLDQ